MPAKSKEPIRFKIGDKAQVRNRHTGKIVDDGEIIHVTQIEVRFRSSRPYGTTSSGQRSLFAQFVYRREGDKWIERRRNQYELF